MISCPEILLTLWRNTSLCWKFAMQQPDKLKIRLFKVRDSYNRQMIKKLIFKHVAILRCYFLPLQRTYNLQYRNTFTAQISSSEKSKVKEHSMLVEVVYRFSSGSRCAYDSWFHECCFHDIFSNVSFLLLWKNQLSVTSAVTYFCSEQLEKYLEEGAHLNKIGWIGHILL